MSTQESFARMWAALEPVGRSPQSGGYRRFAWTDEDAELRRWFVGEAAARGLDVLVDRAGNQWAWWGDPDASGPGVVTGSHLDSVPDGGAFDGPLGVVSGLLAIDVLRERAIVPSRPIAVVNFADEEGARFGVACAGSRVITGALPADRALSLRDGDGTTMADALTRQGHSTDLGRDDETLRRIGTFVELHVEQGRGLIDLDRPVAVGSSIWPHGRWRLDLLGAANHAGTTRLADRDDPMLALALAIGAARTAAQERGCLATIGKVLVEPNGVNAIPSRVQAWLDARGPDEAEVHSVVAAVAARVGVEAVAESVTPATSFDPALVQRLAALLDGAPVLATGAGHDAGILAAAGIPAAMLFVRNPTGVSHSPAEHAETADCVAGVDALADVLADLAATAKQAADERCLAGVLQIVGQHADQSHSEGDRRIPVLVDDAVEVVGGDTTEVLDRLLVHGVVVTDQQLGGCAHCRDVRLRYARSRSRRGRRAGRTDRPSRRHATTCVRSATSATWSSWMRVRCQTSQAIELPRPSIRRASCSSSSPSTARCTTCLIRPNASMSKAV